jgi:hypothetical protein
MNTPLHPRHTLLWLVLTVVVVSLLAGTGVGLAAHKQTFTGEVGDAMCGNKHMEGTPAECTRTCVSKGSKFALVVDEKVYILDTANQTFLSTLNKQAGQKVTVTGTLNGDTIEVSSVAAK